MTVGLNTAAPATTNYQAAKPEAKNEKQAEKKSNKTKIIIGVGAAAVAATAIALLAIRHKNANKATTQALTVIKDQAMSTTGAKVEQKAQEAAANLTTGSAAEKARIEKEIKHLEGVIKYATENPKGAGEHGRPENLAKLKLKVEKLKSKLGNLQ